MQVEVTGVLRSAVGGEATLAIEATTVRELINKLIERYPKLHAHVDDGIAVSVNGHIYRDNWSASIPPDAEVFLLPRLQGG